MYILNSQKGREGISFSYSSRMTGVNNSLGGTGMAKLLMKQDSDQHPSPRIKGCFTPPGVLTPGAEQGVRRAVTDVS